MHTHVCTMSPSSPTPDTRSTQWEDPRVVKLKNAAIAVSNTPHHCRIQCPSPGTHHLMHSIHCLPPLPSPPLPHFRLSHTHVTTSASVSRSGPTCRSHQRHRSSLRYLFAEKDCSRTVTGESWVSVTRRPCGVVSGLSLTRRRAWTMGAWHGSGSSCSHTRCSTRTLDCLSIPPGVWKEGREGEGRSVGRR